MHCKSELKLEVRYYETDQMGIVHHSNYVRYFECGRHKFLIDLGFPIEKIEEMGIVMPVVSVTCNYKKPAVMGDILTIITSIDKEPKAKVEVNTMIYNQNMDLVCTGSVILGVLHGTSRKPTRVPQYLLDAFNSYNNTI